MCISGLGFLEATSKQSRSIRSNLEYPKWNVFIFEWIEKQQLQKFLGKYFQVLFTIKSYGSNPSPKTLSSPWPSADRPFSTGCEQLRAFCYACKLMKAMMMSTGAWGGCRGRQFIYFLYQVLLLLSFNWSCHWDCRCGTAKVNKLIEKHYEIIVYFDCFKSISARSGQYC